MKKYANIQQNIDITNKNINIKVMKGSSSGRWVIWDLVVMFVLFIINYKGLRKEQIQDEREPK
jgi:hypothetical protein